ncbi:MAG: radical SAM protein [Bacteroidia bacterium]|nr:radical SAM protein [Bacteroidia bacterium]
MNCNLKCLHCYSESAPGLRGQLEIGALNDFLSSAFDEGYNSIAVSGGDPFLYHDLDKLLKYTFSAGYYNTITTNGGLLKSVRNQELLQFVNLVAVSIDGYKEEHNFIRNNVAAFDHMLAALEVLRQHKTNFGLIHMLHNEPIEVLSWLCEFAIAEKAGLVHLHPVEIMGRASAIASKLELTEEMKHQFYILFQYYKQKYDGKLKMQIDLIHRDHILEFPQLAYQYNCTDICDTNYFRELIIDEKGNILPVTYGMPVEYALGNIQERISLTEMIKRFRQLKLSKLRELYTDVYSQIRDDEDHELINFPESVVNHARKIIKEDSNFEMAF